MRRSISREVTFTREEVVHAIWHFMKSMDLPVPEKPGLLSVEDVESVCIRWHESDELQPADRLR